MTAVDLAQLRLRLDELTPLDISSLDDARLTWLPPLQHLARRRAVTEIVNALQAMKSRSQRLQRVAEFYCWLVQRHDISPWTPFRFKRSSLLADFARVLTRLASVLRGRGYDVALAWTADGGTVYACLLTQDIERELIPEHQVSFVALWPGLPLLAVHAPENRTKPSVLRALDAALGGEPAELLAAPPGGLGTTLRACFPHLSLKVRDSALNVPGEARLADRAVSHGDEDEQRLEKWHAALAGLGSSLCPVDDTYSITDGKGTWVHFEGPGLFEKLRKLYVSGIEAVISKPMLPAFLGKHHHVVDYISE
ncbi:hypothetical protein V5799_015033 [Amblyomma americanum]|uniref:Uncharacterized protein n=1 Tax=Amblyomma americanum TaxID=6943 RepID=A0AAQ4E1B1_AMBAM